MFTPNENGTYTAILEDDNAHAWTEIYLPFLGWTPVEVTPGMEAELYGDIYMEETESETETETETSDSESDSGKRNFLFRLQVPAWLKKNLDVILIAVQILLVTAIILCAIIRILSQRKRRRGLGMSAQKRIEALYFSLYRILTLSGMPENYTIADYDQKDLLNYLAQCSSQVTKEDLVHLQRLILQIHYGWKAPEQADVEWMDGLYRSMWKNLCRRISLKKTAELSVERLMIEFPISKKRYIFLENVIFPQKLLCIILISVERISFLITHY